MKRIPLSKGFHALIDDEDFEHVSQHKWYASIESRGTKVYAVRRAKIGEPEYVPDIKTKIRLHRWILGLPCRPGPDDLVVDHLNGDGLDCTRANLSLCTQSENMRRCENWQRKKKVTEEDLCL